MWRRARRVRRAGRGNGPGAIPEPRSGPPPTIRSRCVVNGHEWAKRQADQVADLLGRVFVPGCITTDPPYLLCTGGSVVARLVSPSR
jgi:hypothetical protein